MKKTSFFLETCCFRPIQPHRAMSRYVPFSKKNFFPKLQNFVCHKNLRLPTRSPFLGSYGPKFANFYTKFQKIKMKKNRTFLKKREKCENGIYSHIHFCSRMSRKWWKYEKIDFPKLQKISVPYKFAVAYPLSLFRLIRPKIC